ncbi:helix-turn-helix transcriptional regulator [Hazenella sp. IB182357]|uniref:Helix-turn-helix transcriptional regulator n=1 Tax=Polycladospora coralii TaxID=2771432 RepID=A0A926N943_9BACL|nr:helix-turn-helix transcriptional regulator [Polycladospora coralii]MBD1372097.1 helix-turn-helix transcriptional regulator [Polycladospora coralii]MBS7530603.1 helix-turn-helix transcriptional regulator [Polycladospora coralii]
MSNMNIGEKIRQLRLHKRLTQAELVKEISSLTYLSRIENGNINPSKAFVDAIAPRLDVTPNDLWGEDPDIYERINTITSDYKEHRVLTDEDASLLHLNATVTHPPEYYLKIYSTLIRFYCENSEQNYNKAYDIYLLSKNFVSDTTTASPSYLMDYYIACGNLFYYKQDYVKTNAYYELAEQFIDIRDESLALASLYYNIGIVKRRISKDNATCLFYLKTAYNIFKKYGDSTKIIGVLIGMGNNLIETNKLDQAFNYYKEAECILKTPVSFAQSVIEYNFGEISRLKEEYDKSISHFQRSIDICNHIQNVGTKLGCYHRLIEIYSKLKDWTQSDYYLQKSFDEVDPENHKFLYLELVTIQAQIYLLRGDEQKYEKEMKKVIELAKRMDQYMFIHKLANELANYYYKQRAYKKSADSFMLASQYEGKNPLKSLDIN